MAIQSYEDLYNQMMTVGTWSIRDRKTGVVTSEDNEDLAEGLNKMVPEKIRKRGPNTIMDYVLNKMMDKKKIK